jgi:hypothetical protein
MVNRRVAAPSVAAKSTRLDMGFLDPMKASEP